MSFRNIGKMIVYILRHIEVLLCLRKTHYKTHTFPRTNARYEYYRHVEKFKKPYA